MNLLTAFTPICRPQTRKGGAMRIFLLVFSMCLFTSVAFATEEKERIMYNGEMRILHNGLLT